MHPINTEFFTPEELRAQADILDRTARRPGFSLAAIADLATSALNKRKRAQKLQDAADLRESAADLETRRLYAKPSTTANPYGLTA